MTDTPPAQTVSPVEPSPGVLDYRKLVQNAPDVVEGYDLTRDKMILVDVPFVIIGITYRDGIPRTVRVDGKTEKIPTNYLSVEVVTADAATLARRIERGQLLPPLRVDANETIIFNDGSTGVARQLTEWAHLKGLIDVGPFDATGGQAGESPFDRYRTAWVRGTEEAEKGFRGYPLLWAPRGLRVSEYTPDGFEEDSQTFYLA